MWLICLWASKDFNNGCLLSGFSFLSSSFAINILLALFGAWSCLLHFAEFRNLRVRQVSQGYSKEQTYVGKEMIENCQRGVYPNSYCFTPDFHLCAQPSPPQVGTSQSLSTHRHHVLLPSPAAHQESPDGPTPGSFQWTPISDQPLCQPDTWIKPSWLLQSHLQGAQRHTCSGDSSNLSLDYGWPHLAICLEFLTQPPHSLKDMLPMYKAGLALMPLPFLAPSLTK